MLLIFHVDYEFYILVSNAIVHQMVHRGPLNTLKTLNKFFLLSYLQNKIKRRLNLKPVVKEILQTRLNESIFFERKIELTYHR